jgi:hypothetical protein
MWIAGFAACVVVHLLSESDSMRKARDGQEGVRHMLTGAQLER